MMTRFQAINASETPSDELIAVPRRRPGRWLTALLIVVLAAMAGRTAVVNPHFQWHLVAKYFTADAILQGLLRTLELTAIAMILAIVLGVILAVIRESSNPLTSAASKMYVWVFRGTPLLVQILFWFNLSALYPRLSLSIPFGPELIGGSTNALISPFVAALLGLALNEAAYMAEIVRSGILSVETGQVEASSALGMTRLLTMRRIILPQALRVIIPPTGNELITTLKNTSLVSVIGLPELLYSAQLISSQTYQYIPLLIVATLWYLLITSVLTAGQLRLERKLKRDRARWSLRRTAQRREAQTQPSTIGPGGQK